MGPEGLTRQQSNAILTLVRDDLLASCKLGVRVNVGSFLFLFLKLHKKITEIITRWFPRCLKKALDIIVNCNDTVQLRR